MDERMKKEVIGVVKKEFEMEMVPHAEWIVEKLFEKHEITPRLLLAGMAMCGLLANNRVVVDKTQPYDEIADWSVEQADAVLARLEARDD